MATLAILLGSVQGFAASKGTAEHVVVIVWDGMRPDFIRPQYAPNLSKLAAEGVFFQNNHSQYVTSTEVNGTCLATGVFPDRTGIMANSDYRPDIGWLGATGTETLEAIRRSDIITGGKHIAIPTIAEILHEHGIRTAVAGTKPVALLFDRANRRPNDAAKESGVVYRGKSIPNAVVDQVKKDQDNHDFGNTNTIPNNAQDEWTTRALTRTLWKKGVPKFSLLWMSDPDFSQHDSAPGSDKALGGIASVDTQLGTVLKTLEEKKVADKTDVIVVSDHGFSTIQRGVDVVEALKKGGIKATRKFEDPEPGDVMVVGLGGTSLIYVVDSDKAMIQKIVDFLQTTDFASVIFSKLDLPGTFPLDTIHIGTSSSPDIVVAYRWSAEKSDNGTPGMLVSDNGTKGRGTHASLGHFDVNNTLVAAGPDFKKGLVNKTPTGNIDVAPTILWILGVKAPQPLDGRVLVEAMTHQTDKVIEPVTEFMQTSRTNGMFIWKQQLKVTRYGNAVYFDEGTGGASLR